MRTTLVIVPYDTALRGVRMGAGPERLLEAGIVERLRGAGHDVEVAEVATISAPPAEIRGAFELARGIAAAVRAAREAGRFPFVLAGNCISSLGTVAGLGGDVAVCWLDAHGDFNTPETTIGGFLDGMALATITGRSWSELAAHILGFTPIPEERVVLAGARDLDPLEARLLASSAITHLSPAQLREGALAGAARALAASAGALYLHIDLDVLDPAEGRANGFAAPGGLSRAELGEVVQTVARHIPIRAAALTAYDPAADADGRACAVALEIVETSLRHATA